MRVKIADKIADNGNADRITASESKDRAKDGHKDGVKDGRKERLLAEITDTFYRKAENEDLDPVIVNVAVKDIQGMLSKGRKKRGKRCLTCGDG